MLISELKFATKGRIYFRRPFAWVRPSLFVPSEPVHHPRWLHGGRWQAVVIFFWSSLGAVMPYTRDVMLTLPPPGAGGRVHGSYGADARADALTLGRRRPEDDAAGHMAGAAGSSCKTGWYRARPVRNVTGKAAGVFNDSIIRTRVHVAQQLERLHGLHRDLPLLVLQGGRSGETSARSDDETSPAGCGTRAGRRLLMLARVMSRSRISASRALLVL